MDYLVGGFSVGLLFGIFATLFWTEAQRPKERRQAIPEHFSRARYRLTCNECGFEMVFNGSEHAATFARGAGWKEHASAHTCNVCLDRALLRGRMAPPIRG